MRTEAYETARRCTATRPDGSPCRAWATWAHPGQVCVSHAGRHHAGPMSSAKLGYAGRPKPPACNCNAYGFPHRPASGLCRWPLPPAQRSPIPPGTHSAGWTRPKPVPAHWRVLGLKTREDVRRWEQRERDEAKRKARLERADKTAKTN